MAAALITPRDLLVPAGEAATLEVELERRILPFFDPPRAGEEIEVEGLGRARTGADGVAAFPLGALGIGTHRYPVRACGASVEALVAVIPREAPVFITDIDHTIADVSSVGFIFKPLGWVHPVAGAPEALNRIARSMAVVYLTARDHLWRAKTKEWLARNGFPDGPLYLRRNTRFWTASPREHKIARLGELRSRFSALQWGVGDTRGDMEAYVAHGIRPIVMKPARQGPLPGFPAECHYTRTWESIADLIK